MSITCISRDFDVPYSRLYSRLRGRKTLYVRPPTNTRLIRAGEVAICSYVDRLDRSNLSARSGDLRGAADLVLEQKALHATRATSRDPLTPLKPLGTPGLHDLLGVAGIISPSLVDARVSSPIEGGLTSVTQEDLLGTV